MSTKTPLQGGGRVTLAACAVAVLAVAGALNSYHIASLTAEQYPDTYGISRSEIRFAPLLAQTDAHAKLGYLTDLDPSQTAYGTAFLGAQYALAPRVLIALGPGMSQPLEWAVGNFSKPQDYAAAGDAHGYALAGDLGNGVVLFRRKGSSK